MRKLIDYKKIPELSFLSGVNLYFTDKGRALESIMELLIAMRCNFKGTSVPVTEVFPFLRSTCIGMKCIRPLSTFVPKKITSKNAPSIYKTILAQKDYVLVRPPLMSSCADNDILFPKDGVGHNRLSISFQYKNVDNFFSIKMLNSELKKHRHFLEAISADSGLSSCNEPFSVFVLVLTGKGMPGIEKLRGRVLDSDDNNLGFTVPVGMQLYIMTELDMSDFMGEKNLEVIRTLKQT